MWGDRLPPPTDPSCPRSSCATPPVAPHPRRRARSPSVPLQQRARRRCRCWHATAAQGAVCGLAVLGPARAHRPVGRPAGGVTWAADLAHGRSGDKGDTCNVGLVAYDDAGFALPQREVTAERVREHFGDLVRGTASASCRTSAPSTSSSPAPSMAGGVALRSDHLGKVMYAWLLRMKSSHERRRPRHPARQPRHRHAEPSRGAQPARSGDGARIARRDDVAVRRRLGAVRRHCRRRRGVLRGRQPAPDGPLSRACRARGLRLAGGDRRAAPADAACEACRRRGWPAYAGGMGLAGMCDIVLATERSSFALRRRGSGCSR